MIQKPRGTIDILPTESPLWQWVEQTIKDTAALYGYSEIRLPTFESSELYKRGVGETSDVVQKEMYSFEDNEGRSITLRPEGTAGVVRSVIENSLVSGPMPLPLYYLISCFRYEKPEAGRSREFYQFGVEQFGAENPAADANVISLGWDIFKNLGLDVSLEINSIGCRHCRPKYHKALHDYFEKSKDDLCETCLDRLNKNPLRILDCKSPVCSEIAKNAPKTVDYLCPECEKHLEKLKKYLDTAGIKYNINPKIVRGLDYYQRTVFEFISEDIGSKSTICGGGRYDGLVEELGGPRLPGIGFAMGLTRVMLALNKKENLPDLSNKPHLYIASMGEGARLKSFEMSLALKKFGLNVTFDQVGRSLKAQMKYADKTGAKYSLVLGDSELEKGSAVLKNMENGDTTEVDINNFEKIEEIIK
ncbi:MAG: histidine--tRNA ligase [Ruminococcaceae bacterium]|nr:histidine--tRNA ligase [Oscillospiraceae bacterium]